MFPKISDFCSHVHSRFRAVLVISYFTSLLSWNTSLFRKRW